MSDSVVVDASLAIKWVLQEPHTPEAIALMNEWTRRQVRMLAPCLLAFEVANAFYKRVSRGELLLDDAQQALVNLLRAGLVLDHDRRTHQLAMELARQLGQSASYDAHYLALAVRESCDYWTADERLWNAVKSQLPWVRWVGGFRPTRTSSPT